MNKKVLSLVLCFMLIFSLTACGGNSDTGNSDTGDSVEMITLSDAQNYCFAAGSYSEGMTFYQTVTCKVTATSDYSTIYYIPVDEDGKESSTTRFIVRDGSFIYTTTDGAIAQVYSDYSIRRN